MRILIAHHHRTLLGGIETYLASVLPRLRERGHEILFAHEAAADKAYPLLPLPDGVVAVDLQNGVRGVLQQICRWKPDVAYVHALHQLDFQRTIVNEYPTAVFAHGYYGLCISGSKTWKRVPAQPCGKKFDWKCLFYFHARSCGGSNPVTMVRDYFLRAQQLEIFRRCEAILTHGGQMQREYIAQGIPAERVFALPHFVEKSAVIPQSHQLGSTTKLLFVGRFDELKGGSVLLAALPMIAEKLGGAIDLKMVGSGSMANDWKRIAATLQSDRVRVEFPGWLRRDAIERTMAESDLLVAPSIWPEPFGQVGLEAAGVGLPAVAFDVGGISSWLRDGVNGQLAPGNPPTPRGLAETIVKALGNSEHYAKLRAGAEQVAAEFSIDRHLEALNTVLEKVAARR
jgi:glycosyltransferase involved in cell wall biosynthesis